MPGRRSAVSRRATAGQQGLTLCRASSDETSIVAAGGRARGVRDRAGPRAAGRGRRSENVSNSTRRRDSGGAGAAMLCRASSDEDVDCGCRLGRARGVRDPAGPQAAGRVAASENVSNGTRRHVPAEAGRDAVPQEFRTRRRCGCGGRAAAFVTRAGPRAAGRAAASTSRTARGDATARRQGGAMRCRSVLVAASTPVGRVRHGRLGRAPTTPSARTSARD